MWKLIILQFIVKFVVRQCCSRDKDENCVVEASAQLLTDQIPRTIKPPHSKKQKKRKQRYNFSAPVSTPARYCFFISWHLSHSNFATPLANSMPRNSCKKGKRISTKGKNEKITSRGSGDFFCFLLLVFTVGWGSNFDVFSESARWGRMIVPTRRRDRTNRWTNRRKVTIARREEAIIRVTFEGVIICKRANFDK